MPPFLKLLLTVTCTPIVVSPNLLGIWPIVVIKRSVLCVLRKT